MINHLNYLKGISNVGFSVIPFQEISKKGMTDISEWRLANIIQLAYN